MAKILGDGKRQRTKAFSELQSHYLFEDKFGRPGRGNDKGNVEGEQGRRKAGEEGNRLLADAVKAYEHALTIYTLNVFPQA